MANPITRKLDATPEDETDNQPEKEELLSLEELEAYSTRVKNYYDKQTKNALKKAKKEHGKISSSLANLKNLDFYKNNIAPKLFIKRDLAPSIKRRDDNG